VRVSVRKLEGVESVVVSLERGLASIQLRSGNRVTLQQVRQLVKNNGFNPRDASVTVVGELTQEGNDAALSVTGTSTVLTIAPDAANPSAFQTVRERISAGRRKAVLEGTVAEPKATDARDRITVHQIQQDGLK
jgi:hypothetical protein